MLDLYTTQHKDDDIWQFADEMSRDYADEGSEDPALLETFSRLWEETPPDDADSSMRLCARFLLKELVELRPLHDADFARGCEVASIDPQQSTLWRFWLRAQRKLSIELGPGLSTI